MVVPARDAVEALAVLKKQIPFDLLLTDMVLGDGLDGIELAGRILEAKPETKVLILSGFPDSSVLAAQKGYPILKKPFTPMSLVGSVRSALTARIPPQSATQQKLKTRKDCG